MHFEEFQKKNSKNYFDKPTALKITNINNVTNIKLKNLYQSAFKVET